MNNLKIFIWILFFSISSGFCIVLTFQFFGNSNNINTDNIIAYIFSFLILIACVVYMTKFMRIEKTTKMQLIKNNKKPLLEWFYSYEQWLPYALEIVKRKKKKIYKTYALVYLGIVSFICYVYFYAYDIFYGIIFLIFSFSVPIVVSSMMKFKILKNVYYNTVKPNIRITFDGFLINGQLSQPFDSCSRINKIEIENLNTKKCLMIEIMNPVKGGARYKKHYLLYPNCDRIEDENIMNNISYLFKVKDECNIYSQSYKVPTHNNG